MTLPHDPICDQTPLRDELDVLLELDRDLSVPRDLAARVLGGLRVREERALDALLEVGRDPSAEAAPTGLTERVLAAVRAEERSMRRRPTSTWLRSQRTAKLAAAAAVLAFAFGALRIAVNRRPGAESPAQGGVHIAAEARTLEEAPDGLLELLPVLERWELVTGDDAVLDPADLDTLAVVEGEDELIALLAAEENG